MDLPPIDEVVVTGQRREQSVIDFAGNVAWVDRQRLAWLAPQHMQDVLNLVPGAWIARGSGQEHQTALRSPLLGGGGGCGGLLPLEDGIPVRPAGFCNINLFLELYPEAARFIEVIRGPGNALHGSNALHGIVNVLMPTPGAAREPAVSLEVGTHRFLRGQVQLPGDVDAPWLVAGTYTHDGGFRDDSGYEQGKVHGKWVRRGAESDLVIGFTATRLDQQSAGFIEGFDAYRDPELARSNPDPDAFRKANSQRLYGLWTRALPTGDLDIRTTIRHSDMRFRHHERPGRPEEHNGHHGFGTLISITSERAPAVIQFGLDIDWHKSFLEQVQTGPAQGGQRQQAIFPEGRHYDYEVTALNAAPYVQAEWPLAGGWSLGAGARLEFTAYRYDNRMLDGDTREDGTPCGFGGCVYSRPADRTDRFLDLLPNAFASYHLNERTTLFVNLARGYRVPQALELYRLQNGQRVSELDPETLDSLELGIKSGWERGFLELSAYAMRKRDGTFVDPEGFNVSGARSRHAGIETLLEWTPNSFLTLNANIAYGRHRYDFDAQGRGSKFVSGLNMASAPRWLGSAELRYRPNQRLAVGVQLTAVGGYFLDSLNRHDYPGHRLLNARVAWTVSPSNVVLLRGINLTDRAYADRATFAMGDYRYLPGRGRGWFLEFRHLLDQER